MGCDRRGGVSGSEEIIWEPMEPGPLVLVELVVHLVVRNVEGIRHRAFLVRLAATPSRTNMQWK